MAILNSKTNPSDLDIYNHRIKKKINLIWVTQFLNLIKNKKEISKIKNLKINDIGCNLFQFYKGIKKKKLRYNYFGYEFDRTYINYGLKFFPELKKKYKLANIEKINFKTCDVSVISATLEHLNSPFSTLGNILKSTRKMILLRTFCGRKNIKKLYYNAAYIKKPYYINQYSLKKIKEIFKKYGFSKITIITDKATHGKYIKMYSEIRRKFCILQGLKLKKGL
jgi:hypothetical protein